MSVMSKYNLHMVNVYQRTLSTSRWYRYLAWTRMEEKILTTSSKRQRRSSENKSNERIFACTHSEGSSSMNNGLNFPVVHPSLLTSHDPFNAFALRTGTFPMLGQSAVLIPQSLFQFQPRIAYSTCTKVRTGDIYSSSEPHQPGTSTHQNINHQSDKHSDTNWDVVRPKEKHRYYGHKDHRQKSYKHKPSRKEKSDTFGFSELPRKWEYTETGLQHEKQQSSSSKSGLPFTVMSYNILAQELLENHLFLYNGCSPESLDWQMRSEKLLTEFKYYNPDIICLQEVQYDHYESVFRKRLMRMGYGCEYIKRSGDKPDGCATFYKLNTFSLLQSTPVEYQKGGLLDRDNVALILELAPNTKLYHGSVKKLCVANTHLLYNPRRGDVKLAQLMVLLAELDKLLYRPAKHEGDIKRSEKITRYLPLVLCGDFNSEPHSDIYQFLATGYFNYEGRIARQLSGQSDGYHGRTIQLKKHFFNERFGITDQCQYASDVLKRHQHNLVQTRKNDWISKETINTDSEIIQTRNDWVSKETINTDSAVIQTRNDWVSKETINTDSGSTNIDNFTSTSSENWNAKIDQQSSRVEVPGSDRLVQAGETAAENWDAEIQENKVDLVNPISPSINPYFSHASGKIWHKFNLISAYKHRIQRFGFKEDEVTTQHNSQGCCVDYIFYSGSRSTRQQGQPAKTEGKLKLLARCGLMSNQEIYYMGGLPNKVQPSDHVHLLSKFLLK